jgi:hypothetical protein
MNLTSIVTDFSKRLQAVINAEATRRAHATVLSALGGPARRGPGRPPKNPLAAATVAKRSRRKAPIQLCPVPGCKNPAAPVYGMVCAKHKDVKKSLIKKYREARMAKKLKAAA